MASCPCPECHARLQIPDALAGKKIRCPKCKNTLTVPVPAAAIASAARAKPSPRPKSSEATFETVQPRHDPETSFTPVKKASAPARSRWPADDDFDDPPVVRSKAKKRAKAKQSTFPWLLLSILGGVGCILVVVAIAVIFTVTGSSKKVARKNPIDAADVAVAKENAANRGAAVREKPEVNVQAAFAKPQEPLPNTISPDTTQRVKKSTAHIRVTFANGLSGEGSGFFALERGLVVSNAHVVGMLHTMEKPRTIEVTINSGEPDEYSRNAMILGVDQDEDLALLRLDGERASLPPPLLVDYISPLSELQKVYVFGFPFGSQLGKSITVAESSISSFRKNKEGLLQQVQINGGIHQGNSGGPVVDARGNVVGVSVSIIRGTLINFAIPGEKVQGMVQGRVLTSNAGEPYKEAGNIRMPLKLACLDPMSRVQSVKLDVWTGPAGVSRPGGIVPPAAQMGDGPKKSMAMNYAFNLAQGDVTLPAIPAGQVLWVQPVFQQTTGQVAWSHAFTVPTANSTPLERKTTNLAINMAGAAERTIDLTTKSIVHFHGGGQKFDMAQKVNAEVLETVKPRGKGDFDVRLTVGKTSVNTGAEDKLAPFKNDKALQLFRSFIYTFTVAPDGRLLEVGTPTWDSRIDLNTRQDADDLAALLRNSYEVASFNVPQADTRPMESWNAKIQMLFGTSKMMQKADVNLTCTFEGVRVNGDTKEGFIRFEGESRPLFKNRDFLKAKVQGYALLDLNKGYFSKSHVTVRSDVEFGDIFVASTFEADIARTPGNPKSIAPAPALKVPGGPVNTVVTGKKILEKSGVLLATDPIYPDFDNPHHAVPIDLTQGKTYIIDLKQAPGQFFDPYLILEDPAGAIIAEDDDSGKIPGSPLDAQIRIQATQSGQHRIIVTAFDSIQDGGSYVLRVTELENGAAVANPKGINPKGGINRKTPQPKAPQPGGPKAGPKAIGPKASLDRRGPGNWEMEVAKMSEWTRPERTASRLPRAILQNSIGV